MNGTEDLTRVRWQVGNTHRFRFGWLFAAAKPGGLETVIDVRGRVHQLIPGAAVSA